MTEIAAAARAAGLGHEPRNQLLIGLATRLADGYTAAAPTLATAVRAYRAEHPQPDWLSVAYTMAAQDLWDGEAWLELAYRQADLTRATGTLALLPYALDYLAGHRIHAGDLPAAAELVRGTALAPARAP